jgi:Tol biopolymer transport system component
MNADGSSITRLTHDPSHDWAPTWAPDSSAIAFESDREGRVAIYVMHADGTEVHKLIDTQDACCPAW